jgi:hypothetical protein
MFIFAKNISANILETNISMASSTTNDCNLFNLIPEYKELDNALKRGLSWYDIIYPEGETYLVNEFHLNKRARPYTKKFSLEKKAVKKSRRS